jgi:hypothetical protein
MDVFEVKAGMSRILAPQCKSLSGLLAHRIGLRVEAPPERARRP